MLTIQLSSEVEARLSMLAQAAGRSESDYARDVLLEHLEDLEDLEVAEQRMEDLRAGRSRIYSLDEVERDLGLAD